MRRGENGSAGMHSLTLSVLPSHVVARRGGICFLSLLLEFDASSIERDSVYTRVKARHNCFFTCSYPFVSSVQLIKSKFEKNTDVM